MYDVELSDQDVNFIRWSLQVAADALAMQEGEALPPGDALGYIAHLEALEERLVSQVRPQRHGTSNDSGYEQMSFDLDLP